METIQIVAYDENWPRIFEELYEVLSGALGQTATAIEHVGSTSVPGLAAKPIIDIDVVVDGPQGVYEAIRKLGEIGYQHRGNLGIEGREAFRKPDHAPPHHLYVCPRGSLALRNHLAIRDALRRDTDLAAEYGRLKSALAREFSGDIDGYISGKTGFLLEVLGRNGITPDELAAIREANGS